MERKTKIVVTLGPASSSRERLTALIQAGIDVVRLNFSHGEPEEHAERARLVREIAAECGRTVGVLVDLQGPKIRIGKFESGAVHLEVGAHFLLDLNLEPGNVTRVGLEYPSLTEEVAPGDLLMLDDGKIELTVEEVHASSVLTRVKTGGRLSNLKGINRQGGGFSAPALTDKDREDILTAADIRADFVAVSFPRSAEDMNLARELMNQAGLSATLIAKIERAEAITALEEIIEASDAIMVARGDLALEVGDAAVPGLQKHMIRLARRFNRPVVTATQMMESMIHSPVPTRAEVSDVANAVLDGTDAVMLSAETAVGEFPIETVRAMARVCQEAEKVNVHSADERRRVDDIQLVELAIAHSAIHCADQLGVKAIAALTQSGTTARFLSRLNTQVPIYALSPLPSTRARLTLLRNVCPVDFSPSSTHPESIMVEAESALRARGVLTHGDLMLLTIGEPIGKPGGTNALKIIRVGDHDPS